MTKDTFDFGAFMAKAAQPDNDTTREILRDAVSDEMDTVMSEVAPRIWAIISQEMNRDPQNNIHLNAVLNSAIFAILAWVAACTPKGSTNDRDNDEVLRSKILANLDHSLANGRNPDTARQLGMIAMNVGTLKLLEDALSGLSKVVVANSMVIKGIHTHLSKDRKD